MTLKIEIFVPSEHVDAKKADIYLASALLAIGYSRGPIAEIAARHEAAVRGVEAAVASAPRLLVPERWEEGARAVPSEQPATVLDEPSVQAAVAKRERGKPSPGRARRTKEEIAEDEAAERSEQQVGIASYVELPADATGDQVAEAFAGVRAGISSGEERINPEDAADEAAEQPQRSPLEQLRLLMGAVGRKHGLAYATQIPGKLGKPIAELTDEELPGAISQVQALLDADKPDEAPVTAVEKAVPQTTLAATKQDLLNAMFDYAEFADGTRDQTKMAFTMKDVPVVFEKLFGVQKLSEVPETGYGQAIEGIREMLAKDPFKRARG